MLMINVPHKPTSADSTIKRLFHNRCRMYVMLEPLLLHVCPLHLRHRLLICWFCRLCCCKRLCCRVKACNYGSYPCSLVESYFCSSCWTTRWCKTCSCQICLVWVSSPLAINHVTTDHNNNCCFRDVNGEVAEEAPCCRCCCLCWIWWEFWCCLGSSVVL